MKKYRVGIMGCTGLVGQQFVRMLEDHPYFEVAAMCSSEKSAGKGYGEAMDWMVSDKIPGYAREMTVLQTTLSSLRKEDVRIVFCALPAAIANDIESQLAREGMYVFSNASSHRMDKDVPILIPDVNAEHLELVRHRSTPGFIVTCSNCSTAGLVTALKPLMGFGLRSINVTTYQAISGAGRRGVASLDILGNVIPLIKNEEDKMEKEPLKILGKLKEGRVEVLDMDINASCCRVPVKDGHLESVVAELEKDVNIEGILEAFDDYKGLPQRLRLPTAPEFPVIARREEDRPQPAKDAYAGTPERARGMAVSVGRVRRKKDKLNFFLLSHNTIRGAAGTCMLNAELSVAQKYVEG